MLQLLGPQLLQYFGSSGNSERWDLAGGSRAPTTHRLGQEEGHRLLEALLSLMTLASTFASTLCSLLGCGVNCCAPVCAPHHEELNLLEPEPKEILYSF